MIWPFVSCICFNVGQIRQCVSGFLCPEPWMIQQTAKQSFTLLLLMQSYVGGGGQWWRTDIKTNSHSNMTGSGMMTVPPFIKCVRESGCDYAPLLKSNCHNRHHRTTLGCVSLTYRRRHRLLRAAWTGCQRFARNVSCQHAVNCPDWSPAGAAHRRRDGGSSEKTEREISWERRNVNESWSDRKKRTWAGWTDSEGQTAGEEETEERGFLGGG